MYHTLYVASLSAAGGGSGSECRVRLLEMMSQEQTGGVTMSTPGRSEEGSSSRTKATKSNLSTVVRGSTNNGVFPQTYIPPILSCGSQSSMGSVKSGIEIGGDGGNLGGGVPYAVDGSHANVNKQQSRLSNASNMKPARHSAKELPVWLISMFLLLHCEDQSFIRCTSGEDERRFSSEGGSGHSGNITPKHQHTRSGDSENDVSSMLHHRSLSLRTRIHAGVHQNHAHCASFILRHLRKFLLLCAVPRNPEACRAIAALAAQSKSSDVRTLETALSTTFKVMGVDQIDLKHRNEHKNIGLDVQLTLEELDRLSLMMQAPSGGPVEEPPIAIGEHVLKCLAIEEINAREASGGRSSTSSLHRLGLMHNGIVTVRDAERILRKYFEEELTIAQQEMEGCENENSDDVSHKLSRLALNNQRLSPSRSRGLSVAESISTDVNTANDSSSYFKELSYCKLRSTTVLLEPNRDYGGFTSNTNNTDTQSVVSLHSQTSSTNHQSTQQDKLLSDSNESGRLHDLHIADCSDTHFYLLQPFEHATIAGCTDCTIVVGAVAGLLHIVVSLWH